MTHLNHIAALGLGVLLLLAPAAIACGEPGGMAAGCPMGGMAARAEMTEMSHHADMAGTLGSTSNSPCDCSDRTAEECCEVRPAPERMQALTLESTKHIVVPAVTHLEMDSRPAPWVRLVKAPPVDTSRRHELGLYTLLSSFLL